MKKTKVIYTAIIGDYDDMPHPKHVMPDWDYVLFSDAGLEGNSGPWDVRKPEVQLQDNTRTARWHKLKPHDLFPEHEHSIWLDSNISTETSFLETRVNQLISAGSPVASFNHIDRNCAYKEAAACLRFEKDNPNTIQQTIEFLSQDGYPHENGLFETNVLYRQHTQSKMVAFAELWWQMLKQYSRRDQLTFNYCLWKLGIQCEYLSEDLSECARNHLGFDYILNHKYRGSLATEAERTRRLEECIQIAKLYISYHRFERGKNMARESLSLSESTQGWNLLGIASFYLQRFDEAMDAFKHAAILSPNDVMIKANLDRVQQAANSLRRPGCE